jgi:hypothetical protein
MRIREKLAQLCDIVAREAERNSEFRRLLEQVLDPQQADLPLREDHIRRVKSRNRPATNSVRRGRRTPAVLDPLALARQDEGALRRALSSLDIEQLKDVVAQYGMDPGKLVMKWKDTGRIIDRIVELSLARSTKGDAFRADKPPATEASGGN